MRGAGAQPAPDKDCGCGRTEGDLRSRPAQPLASPALGETDYEQPRALRERHHSSAARRREKRLGSDAGGPLDDQRRIGEKAAGVAPVLSGAGGCTHQLQCLSRRASDPGAELERCPVVLGRSERHDDRPGAERTSRLDEHCDVARGARKDVAKLRVEWNARSIDQDQIDVVLAFEADEVIARSR